MPIKATHQAAAAPVTLGVYTLAVSGGGIPVHFDFGPGLSGLATLAAWVTVVVLHSLLGATAWGVSTWNDWDLDWYKDRLHPAFLARWSARWLYRIQTEHDAFARHKLAMDDLHRGPTHCLEWCLLVGAVFYTLATLSVVLAPWAWWFALAAFAGTASHVLLDWMTPSGVPFSITWNYLAWSFTAKRRAERVFWRRHAAAWWVPFYDVSWWLRWIRLPRPILADASRPGCEAGLFHTNSGVEHLWVVPALYVSSMLPALAALGILGPIVNFLNPLAA